MADKFLVDSYMKAKDVEQLRDAKSGKHGKHACAIFSPKLC